MTFSILHRRSATAGHIPTTAQLLTGEIAVNTYDGLLYFVQNTGTASMVVIGPTPQSANSLTNTVTISLTGDVTGTTTSNFSSNVSIVSTLASVGTPGTYTAMVTDAKGRVISGSNMVFSGAATGTANGANVVLTLANTGVTAGTYQSVVVNSSGLVTSGNATLTSAQIITDLGYTPVNKIGDTMTGALNVNLTTAGPPFFTFVTPGAQTSAPIGAGIGGGAIGWNYATTQAEFDFFNSFNAVTLGATTLGGFWFYQQNAGGTGYTPVVQFAANGLITAGVTPSTTDNSSNVATTAYVNNVFPASKATNGYQKLVSGLIIQWGSGVTAAGTQVVTFPTAFPTACVNVQLTVKGGTTTGQVAAPIYTNTPTATSFTTYAGSAVAYTYSWFALGY